VEVVGPLGEEAAGRDRGSGVSSLGQPAVSPVADYDAARIQRILCPEPTRPGVMSVGRVQLEEGVVGVVVTRMADEGVVRGGGVVGGARWLYRRPRKGHDNGDMRARRCCEDAEGGSGSVVASKAAPRILPSTNRSISLQRLATQLHACHHTLTMAHHDPYVVANLACEALLGIACLPFATMYSYNEW